MPSYEQIIGLTLSALLHFMGLLLVGYLLLDAPPDDIAPALTIRSVELSLADDNKDAPGSAGSAAMPETTQVLPPEPEPQPEPVPTPAPEPEPEPEPENKLPNLLAALFR